MPRILQMLCNLVVEISTIARHQQSLLFRQLNDTLIILQRLSLIKRSYHHWFLDVVYGAILAYCWRLVIMCHIPRLSIKTATSTANLASSLPYYLFKVVHYLRNKYIVFFSFSIRYIYWKRVITSYFRDANKSLSRCKYHSNTI